MVAGAVGEKFFVYNYKEDQLPEIFAKHLKWVFYILKFTKKTLLNCCIDFFIKLNTEFKVFFKWTCEVIRCFKKIGVFFLVTKHISLSSVLNVSLWTIFPLLKNRWAKHDLVIFYSFMNMFSKGYNNLLFNFNCFKWMQWIQLYNKKFAFHRSIRM